MYVVKCFKRSNGRVLVGSIAACLVLSTTVPVYGQFPAGSIGGQCSLCGRFVWGSYDSHDCPYAQIDSQSQPEYDPEPAQGNDSQPSHRPAVRIEPPSRLEREKELSRQSNNLGVECLNRGDNVAAIHYFRQSLEYWSDNPEAKLNLQSANDRIANQALRAMQQAANEAEFARQIAEQNRQVIASVTQQFRQAEDQRKREESNRKVQKTKIRIDGILQGLSADFDNRRSGVTGSSAPDPGIDFMPVIEQDLSPHNDPMVVDARHATGPKPLPAASQPNPFRNAKKAPRNPRTSVLLVALKEGGENWSDSVAHLKKMIQNNPADTAARDAYHFSIGFSSGLNERAVRFPADTEIYSLPDDTGPYVDDAAGPAMSAAKDAIRREDFEAAYRALKIAHQADPKHGGIRALMNLTEGLAAAHMVEQPDDFSQGLLTGLMVEASNFRFPERPKNIR